MSFLIVLLLVYSVLLVSVGIGMGRRVRSSSAFFVAGRRLGPGLLFSTILAANIGAGSTVGAAGLGYRDGASAWWWVGSAGIGSLLLAFWIGPRVWKLAVEHDLHTVGDFLELRYGREVRALVAALLWLGTLSILAGQLIAIAWVLEVVAHVPKAAGCLLGGLVMTVYFAAGGLLSSAWVNLVQLLVLLVGFALAVPFSMEAVGGLDRVMSAGRLADETYFHIWRGTSGWNYLCLLVPAFMVSPGLLQKVFGARDERSVKLGVGMNAFVLLVFAAGPPLLGMMARIHHPGLGNHELALPMILVNELPLVLGGLGLVAVFSAEVSSADAILFMLATSLSQDLYRRFLRPEATDAQVLRAARWAAVAGGAFGVFLAIVTPTVIGALTIFYSLLGVSLFVPVLAGLTLRRLDKKEGILAIGGGVAALLTTQVLTAGRGVGVWTPSLIGLVGSAVAFAAVRIIRRYT